VRGRSLRTQPLSSSAAARRRPSLTRARARRARRIGTEHEKFGFRTADRRPMDYDQVRHILDGLVARRAPARAGCVVARARRARGAARRGAARRGAER